MRIVKQHMMCFAQPHNIKRLTVIFVMRLTSCSTTHRTWLFLKAAISNRIGNITVGLSSILIFGSPSGHAISHNLFAPRSGFPSSMNFTMMRGLPMLAAVGIVARFTASSMSSARLKKIRQRFCDSTLGTPFDHFDHWPCISLFSRSCQTHGGVR